MKKKLNHFWGTYRPILIPTLVYAFADLCYLAAYLAIDREFNIISVQSQTPRHVPIGGLLLFIGLSAAVLCIGILLAGWFDLLNNSAALILSGLAYATGITTYPILKANHQELLPSGFLDTVFLLFGITLFILIAYFLVVVFIVRLNTIGSTPREKTNRRFILKKRGTCEPELPALLTIILVIILFVWKFRDYVTAFLNGGGA